jgi:hypothetical protein
MKQQFKEYIYSRIPRPRNEEFDKWFQITFPGADPNNLMQLFFIWNICQTSMEPWGSWSLEKKYLCDFFGHERNYDPNFVPELCGVLQVPVPEYHTGIARSVRINQDRAKQIMKEWWRFLKHYNKLIAKIPDNVAKIFELPKSSNIYRYQEYLNTRAFNHIFDFQPAFDLFEKECKEGLNNKEEIGRELHGAYGGHLAGVFYKASEGSRFRLYPEGWSITSIPSRYRHVITPRSKGYLELDLKCAHLSICAGVLKIESIQNLLKNGIDPRDIISTDTEIDKSKIKLFIQKIIYGAGDRGLKIALLDNEEREIAEKELKKEEWRRVDNMISNDCIDKVNKINSHYIVKDLRKAIERWDENKAIDAWGYKIKLPKDKKYNVKATMLSWMCNSWEKVILEPIFEIASKSFEFEIVIDQHDGCTIFNNFGDIDEIEERLKDKVQKHAAEYGIYTGISVKNS